MAGLFLFPAMNRLLTARKQRPPETRGTRRQPKRHPTPLNRLFQPAERAYRYRAAARHARAGGARKPKKAVRTILTDVQSLGPEECVFPTPAPPQE